MHAVWQSLSPYVIECMTQDLPWLLPPGAPVSFTVFDAADAYAPVKNALADAAKKVSIVRKQV